MMNIKVIVLVLGLETVGWPLESSRRPDLDWALNGRLLELLTRVARVARVGLTLVMWNWSREHRVCWSSLRRYGLGCLGSSEEVSDPI